jgi:lysozyme
MMSADMKSRLKLLLIQHEGYRNYVYSDSVGKLTIGIGYNLSDRGVSDGWINQQYDEDVDYFYTTLSETYEWFNDLNEIRQMALIDMCFMGLKKFKSFNKMLVALSHHDYDQAAHEMLDSVWARQVGKRANDLAELMIHGHLEV